IDDSWLIRHLKYTHGYGVTLSRVDRITSSGEPDMLISSIPPVSQVPEIDMVRPEIYYGESTDTYIIVGTSEDEFDYPKGETNTYCNYEGEGGITLGFLNRILFAIRERNLKILVSTNIDSDSRILINRNIAERVQKIAPFLTYDDDPYVVTADGKVYWILDAYTTSAYYPYSEPWSKNSDMNYIRNSVKIVVDAYNGTTDFYIIGEDDPIAQTLSRIYPKLFKPIDQMPASLKSHLQYPNALFNIQADVYEKYHMTDVGVFYQNEDLWQISHELYGHSEAQMTPNYFIMKLPGEEKAEFVSTIPYSPSGKSNMSGILTARSDGANYGQLVLFRMPKDRLIYGPAQIEAQINQDVEISKEFALWDNAGSTYSRGNMFVIPVENSIFYVEPVYLEAATGSLPEVKRVIMYYGDLVAYESTLAECLDSLFGEGAGAPLLTANPIESGKQMAEELANQPVEPEPGPDEPAPPDEGNEEPTPPDVTIPDDIDEKTVKEIAAYAVDAYRKAVEAQKNGDWAAYGEYITQLGVYLDQIAGDLPIEEPAEGEEGAPEDGAAETGEGESSAEGNEETEGSQEGD
ncbi:MAG: UPF0182 family protein, partial [Firmicutes bacterium]|nr:UPF0182 family protein [Bacillota bacterium]